MKARVLGLGLCIFLIGSGSYLGAKQALARKFPPQKIVEKVNLKRLEGTWYEIARYPNFFQPQSHIGGTDTYRLQPDGSIQVTYGYFQNSFENPHQTMQAKMWPVNPNSEEGRFKIQFLWPFEADYWLIGLDPEYRYLIVGYPDRSMLWLMSRTPELSVELYQKALQTIQGQHYDVEKLVRVSQPNLANAPL